MSYLNFPYDTELTRNDLSDYELAQIANACLWGKDNAEAAKKICQTIVKGFQKHQLSTFEYSDLLSCLARIHPYTFLDIFVEVEDGIRFPRMRFDDQVREDNPVNQIPENILIDWCEKNPEIRYPQLVISMQTYWKTKETEELSWKPIIFSILRKHQILRKLFRDFKPLYNLCLGVVPTRTYWKQDWFYFLLFMTIRIQWFKIWPRKRIYSYKTLSKKKGEMN